MLQLAMIAAALPAAVCAYRLRQAIVLVADCRRRFRQPEWRHASRPARPWPCRGSRRRLCRSPRPWRRSRLLSPRSSTRRASSGRSSTCRGKGRATFCAVSAHCAKAASTLAASNGAWPRIIRTTVMALLVVLLHQDIRASRSDQIVRSPRLLAEQRQRLRRVPPQLVHCISLVSSGTTDLTNILFHALFRFRLRVSRPCDHEFVIAVVSSRQPIFAPLGWSPKRAAVSPAYRYGECGGRAKVHRRWHS